jgi:hypothetical protein
MKQMRKDFLVSVEWDEEGSGSPTPSDIEAALQNVLRGLVTKLAAMKPAPSVTIRPVAPNE